jgi:CRISPR/Cas system-associated exonuclease Cas4 (RecB family)
VSDDDRVIRASEIGQYAYCARAWWLGSVQGLPSTHRREMAAGEAVHLHHGRGVRTSLGLSRLAYIALISAVVVGIVWLVSSLVG